MFYLSWIYRRSSPIYLILAFLVILLLFANNSSKSSIWTSYSQYEAKNAKNIIYPGNNKDLEAKAQLWEAEIKKHYQTIANQNEVIKKNNDNFQNVKWK